MRLFSSDSEQRWQPVASMLRCGLALVLFSGAGWLSAQTANPEKLFQQGVQAQQRGDDAAAVRAYRELLRAHPEAVAVRVNLGATLAHQKRFSEAIEQYRLVLAHQPGNKMAQVNLALAYEANNDLAAAIKLLEPLHKQSPTDAQLSLLLADCYVHAGRAADALALLAPLAAAQPEDSDVQWLLGTALIQTGRAAEGAERLEKVAAKNASADAWLVAGQTRLSLNQYDLARQDAEAAKLANPKLPGLQTLTGMIQEQTGDYDGAEASLLQAEAADARDYNAQYYLGAIYYFKREMEKARLHLTHALTLAPESTQALYEMALVERADGKTEAALHDLEVVVRKSPAWLQPHVELSALYYRLHRPDDGAQQKQIVDKLMAEQQGQAVH